MKSGHVSNVFYSFGFFLLYIHLFVNIYWLAFQKEYFNPKFSQITVTPVGLGSFPIQMSLMELLLVGGFVLFTIVGLLLERIRLIGIRKEAEAGWRYRNRLKQWYTVISIVLVVWTTFHGYFVRKEFDWVWISGSAFILLYSIFLISFPKMRTGKSQLTK